MPGGFLPRSRLRAGSAQIVLKASASSENRLVKALRRIARANASAAFGPRLRSKPMTAEYKMIDLSDRSRRKQNIRELFLRMIDHLAASEPTVALKASHSDEPGIMYGSLLAEEAVSYPDGFWKILWESIDWPATCGAAGDNRYGVKLLELFGSIGEACEVHGRCRFPLSTLVIAMADLWPDPAVLKFVETSRGTYVRATEHGEQVLKAKGKIKVSRTVVEFYVPAHLFFIDQEGNYEFGRANNLL
jgi:hypothetical protein